MAADTMRAWRSSGDGVARLALEDCPRPVPGPREAVIAVRAAALNFSDLLMLEDKYQVRPPRPFTPGQEVAGIVAAVGEGSTLHLGQAIASKVMWGGFAEQAVVSDAMAIALPDGSDLATAVALPVSYVTALVALEPCGRLRGGETLLVHAAAGAVGLAAVQLGRHLGARVIATAGAADKRALAAAHGAGDGRLLIVGFASGEIPALPANRLLLKRAAAIGVNWSHDSDGDMLAAIQAKLVAMLAAGAIRPHVERRGGLASLPQALADLAERRSSGKLVLCLDEPR
ncbi:MAG: zinc-binding dehydrogenase [Proteobacteria bacterium]|nr:zinc-binding dehydrogenase [Pseudomonadota bacterium]